MSAQRVGQLLGVAATTDATDVLAEVPRERWRSVAVALRDDPELGLTLFDLLTAVDDQERGILVLLRVWSPQHRWGLRLHTRCPAGDLRLASLAGVYAGAAWHERATAEMFGLCFDGHPSPGPLLLPDGAGHPLRKDVVLAGRVAKAWPGAPEPGQSTEDARAAAAAGRRRAQPPGVPRPGTWGSP